MIKKNAPNDPETTMKIRAKIPIFEKAIKLLKEKRKDIEFPTNVEFLKSPNPKKENTIAFNSTMNDYSDLINQKRNDLRNDSVRNNQINQNDSGFGSINKMLDSTKTDNFSKFSDRQLINEMKINEYVNNPELFNEKLKELESKFQSLINLNSYEI